MLSFILFIVILSILIIFHELGHFLAAKKFGVWVQEFGLGYPPRIFGRKIGETIYSINWIPAGGFVRIFGDLADQEKQNFGKLSKRALVKQPKKIRFLVAIAGVTMNLILGVIIFAVVYSILGIPKSTDLVRVVGINKSSPALEAGLKEKDIILAAEVDQERKLLKNSTDLIDLAYKHTGKSIRLIVAREAEEEERLVKTDCPRSIGERECFLVSLISRKDPPDDEGPLGVIITDTEMTKPVWWQRPFLGVLAGFREAFFWGKLIIEGLGEMLKKLIFQGEVPTNVAGPVGIYQAASTIQKEAGFWAFFHFFGILSVNFAIINFLPFPALDGSRFIFLLWETVTRKKLSPRIELAVNQMGMALLLFLLFLITIVDIRRLLGK